MTEFETLCQCGNIVAITEMVGAKFRPSSQYAHIFNDGALIEGATCPQCDSVLTEANIRTQIAKIREEYLSEDERPTLDLAAVQGDVALLMIRLTRERYRNLVRAQATSQTERRLSERLSIIESRALEFATCFGKPADESPEGTPAATVPQEIKDTAWASLCEGLANPEAKLPQFYVDSVLGNDETGDGSGGKPFATISRAMVAGKPSLWAGWHLAPSLQGGTEYIPLWRLPA